MVNIFFTWYNFEHKVAGLQQLFGTEQFSNFPVLVTDRCDHLLVFAPSAYASLTTKSVSKMLGAPQSSR